MRTFARLGIAEEMLPKVRVQRRYEWTGASGELLMEHRFEETGASGWAEWYMMYQPELETALDAACRALPGVQVRPSSPVVAIEQDDDLVTVTVEGGATVTARAVVGCDGGNSFVRQALGVGQDDYGFSEPWMVCDFRLRRPTAGAPGPPGRRSAPADVDHLARARPPPVQLHARLRRGLRHRERPGPGLEAGLATTSRRTTPS